MPPSVAAEEPVYSTVDDVPVPSGIAPGGHFTALLWCKKKGQRVAKRKPFWRASGVEPVIVPASYTVFDGPRHLKRPSSVARQRTRDRGARTIDNVVTVPTTTVNWEGAAELPMEAKEADVGWLPGPVNGSTGRAMPTFTGGQMGPRHSSLHPRSTARQIMRSVQFSRAYKQKVMECALHHQRQWAAQREAPDGIERAFIPRYGRLYELV